MMMELVNNIQLIEFTIQYIQYQVVLGFRMTEWNRNSMGNGTNDWNIVLHYHLVSEFWLLIVIADL